MPTDREYLKYQQAGQLATSGAADAKTAVAQAHSKQRTHSMVSSANAETNVSETIIGVVEFKAKVAGVKLTVPTTNIIGNATNYFVTSIYKRTSAGASQTLVASYNSHASAQGAVTLKVPAAFSVVANADAIVAAGSLLSFATLKYGSGQALDQYSLLDLVLEEI